MIITMSGSSSAASATASSASALPAGGRACQSSWRSAIPLASAWSLTSLIPTATSRIVARPTMTRSMSGPLRMGRPRWIAPSTRTSSPTTISAGPATVEAGARSPARIAEAARPPRVRPAMSPARNDSPSATAVAISNDRTMPFGSAFVPAQMLTRNAIGKASG
jgi:hypothetical protein